MGIFPTMDQTPADQPGLESAENSAPKLQASALELQKLQAEHPELANPVIILNGFSNEQISLIMAAVKALCRPDAQGNPGPLGLDRRDLIFARTTPHSLNAVLKDTILDMSGDHRWLRENPPALPGKKPTD